MASGKSGANLSEGERLLEAGSYNGAIKGIQYKSGKEGIFMVLSRQLKNSNQHLLERCCELIREVIPGATIILYGSRARGDAGPESDYDLLILAKGPVSWRVEDAIREKLYPLELETGAVFSIAAYSEEEWNSSLYRAMPFSQNVRREGIFL